MNARCLPNSPKDAMMCKGFVWRVILQTYSLEETAADTRADGMCAIELVLTDNRYSKYPPHHVVVLEDITDDR